MILLVDNYDSFTFNLYQSIGQLGHKCVVRRNDQLTLNEIERMKPSRIVISPGPGAPISAGLTLAIIKSFAGRIPIFGVCLGHQAIGEAFGGKVVRAQRPRHGKLSKINHDGRGAFKGLPEGFTAARYHSLVVEESSLPSCLEVSARSEDGLIMGLRHKTLEVEGVQFHPESIATTNGIELLANVLESLELLAHG